MTDKLLDESSILYQDHVNFIEALKYIYISNYYLNYKKISDVARQFNKHYMDLSISMHHEMLSRYVVPAAKPAKIYREKILIHQKYYRSECHYYSAIIEGLLEAEKFKYDKKLKKYLNMFGLLRQIIDEIPDVEEDLSSGTITLPILFVHSKTDMKKLILDYWEGRQDFAKIKTFLLEFGGYYETYQLGNDLYQLSQKLKYKLIAKYPFIENLSLFMDLKFAFLNRLKQDNWTDKRPVE